MLNTKSKVEPKFRAITHTSISIDSCGEIKSIVSNSEDEENDATKEDLLHRGARDG